jgi:hypothetical protein
LAELVVGAVAVRECVEAVITPPYESSGGIASIGSVEGVEKSEGAGGREFENEAVPIGFLVTGGAVEVSIAAMACPLGKIVTKSPIITSARG